MTVAKEIELEDPYENMGAQMVREVASKTSDAAQRDGTTTADGPGRGDLSRRSEVRHQRRQPDQSIQRGINKAVAAAVEQLAKISKKVKEQGRDQARSQRFPANWDTTIGEIIADAMDKVGKDGTMHGRRRQKSIETTLDVVEGMQFDKGYSSPYFVTSARNNGSETRRPLTHFELRKEDQQPERFAARITLEKVAKTSKPLLIIAAEEVEGEALAYAREGVEQIAQHDQCVRRQSPRLRATTPQIHDGRHRGDPSAASCITEDPPASKQQKHRPRQTSAAPRALLWTRKTRRLSKTTENPRRSRADVNQIRRQIEETTSDYDREKLQERLAKAGRAAWPSSMSARRPGIRNEGKEGARGRRVAPATRAAVEEGIVVAAAAWR